MTCISVATPPIPDRVDVVAAVDPLPERRAWARDVHRIAHTYATIEELLADADTAFSVASVCTPTTVRLDTVSALAGAGKHLLVEKPMADEIGEAFAVVEAAEQAGVTLAVDQNFRDHYAFGLARDVIRSGEVGAVLAIDHSELQWREVAGWRASAKHHALSVMGVHWFDGFRYLLDADADRVVAQVFTAPSHDARGETDAFIQIRFGDVPVNYVESFASRVERIETIVLGERATLRLTYHQLEIFSGDDVRTMPNPCAGDGKPESAYRSMARLLDAIERGEEPENSGRDNLKTLSLLFAAYESAHTGAPVTLKEGLL